MKEDLAINRSGRRRSPDLKKSKKLNKLVDSLHKNLGSKNLTVTIERYDLGKNRSPDKSSKIPTRKDNEEDSESEPLSQLASRGPKQYPEPKNAISSKQTVEGCTSKDLKCAKMQNKIEDKKMEVVKKEEKITKVNKKEDKVVGKSDEAVKKSVDVKSGKVKSKKVLENSTEVDCKVLDAEKKSKSPQRVTNTHFQSKQGIKKLLESTIRNRMKKRTSDESEQNPPEIKKRKVGRPPKNKDNEKESSTKNPSSMFEEMKFGDEIEKQLKPEIRKKVGRKKKFLGNKRHEEKESESEGKEYQNVSEKANKKVKFSKDEINSEDETEKDRKFSDESDADKNTKKNVHKEDSDTENEKGKKVAKKRQGKKWSIGRNESTGKPRKFVRKKKQKGVQSPRDSPSSDTDCEKSPRKKIKKKSNQMDKHEPCGTESDEKSKNAKFTNKKKSESENSDSSQKLKKTVKVGKKILKLRSRFRRKRVASLNARAKVTCMVDEDSDPIDFNHYITMFPVVVGDDVILRKKKKKGVFMMRRRKQRQPEAPQLEMKDFIVPKRMASLNATAMMAASTDLDRRKRDDEPLKSPSRKDEEVEEKKEEQSDSKKIFKKVEDTAKKNLKKIEESKPEIDVYEFHCDDKPLKITKKKIEHEKKNIPLKKRKRVEMKDSPATSPAHSTEIKILKVSPEQPNEANQEDTVQSDPGKPAQGVLDLRSPQSMAIPPAVDAIFKTSDAVTISGVYIDARCSSQSSSHSYVISGSMQAYNYSVATRTEERRTVTPPPSQPTVAKVRPYNPLGALCGMRIPDQSQSQVHPPNDPHWRPAESKNQSSQESGLTSAFQTPPGQCQPGSNVGWYQPAGPLIHTPYKPPSERQSPEPSTSRPKTPLLEKREEPVAPSPDKVHSPTPEWHNPHPDRGFHHYYPYPPAPYPFYHYPPLPPSSSTQTRDGYNGYPGPPLPHPHPVYPYQGSSYYPPPPPSHQAYPPYDPYGPYRQSANTLVPPPAGSPGSAYPVRPHLVRPTVLPAPTPYYPPYYGCHQQSVPIQPPHYDPRHMRCSCPVRSPTCPKNVQPGPLTGEGVGPGYHVENPHAPVAPGPRALASPASGSVPRNMESQIPGSGAKVVESEVLPSIEKKYLSAKEMKKLLKSIDLETCRTVWKQKKAERKRQKQEKQRTFNGCMMEYSSGTDDLQDNIPLKYLAKEIKLEKVDDFESDLTNSSSSESNPISVKTECIKIEDESVMSPVIVASIADIIVSKTPELKGNDEHNINIKNEESDPLKTLQKKRSFQQKNQLETNTVKKRGRKRTIVTPPKSASPVRRTGSVNSRNSARVSSRSSSATLLETQDSGQEILESDDRKSRQGSSVSCGWSWYGESYEAKVFLSNDDPPVLRQCYPSMRHEEGEIIRVRDSVILRSGMRPNDLPYVAKISAMWDNPDDGEMMISILWFYRPEHTDRGRKPGDKNDEVFASRHRDTTYVACIEDKCHVLTYNEYCRYRGMIARIDEGTWPPSSAPIVPALTKESGDNNSFRLDRFPATKMGADRVFLCRKVYDCRQKRILKNPA